MSLQKNRLAYVFEKFTVDKKLYGRVDHDGLGADLTVPVGGKSIHVKYHFDREEDNYEFGAALGKINPSKHAHTAVLIMKGEPVRGITERLIEDKLVILGSRDGLNKLSDAGIERRLMDDVARIAYYFNQTSQLLGE